MIEFKKTAADAGEITFYDDIGSWWAGTDASSFRSKLNALGPVDKLFMRMHCYGGDVLEGIAIYSTLRDHPAKSKKIKVDGAAASMGSVVMMAFDEREIADGAFVMIHNPWGYMKGESEQFKSQADFLDKIKSNMLDAYTRNNAAKPSREKLASMMDATTWLDAKQALEMGFATRIGDSVKLAASALKPNPFNSAPRAALNLFQNPKGTPEMSLPSTQAELDAQIKAATDKFVVEANAKHQEITAKLEAKTKEHDATVVELAKAKAEKEAAETAKAVAEKAKTEAESAKNATQAKLERAIGAGFQVDGSAAGSAGGGNFAAIVAELVKGGMSEQDAYVKARESNPVAFAASIKPTKK